MVHVVSLLPHVRFMQSQTIIPKTLSLTFLTDYSPQSLETELQHADAIFMPPSHPHLDAHLLRKLTSVRIIQTAGAGFDSVDHQAAAELGLIVCNSPAQNAITVAEYVLAMAITLQRESHFADEQIKNNAYSQVREEILGRGCLEIYGSTVGIIGFGAIGQKVAEYFLSLGANVIAHDVYWSEQFSKKHNVCYVELDELFSSSDIISLHCPLLESTRGLVDAARIKTMKPNAVLINAARGGIIVERDLAEALENNIIRGAAIDNFEKEIPNNDNPLLNLSQKARQKMIFSPHIAGVTRPAFKRMLQQALNNLENCLVNMSAPKFSINGIEKIR